MNGSTKHNGSLLEVRHLRKYFPIKRGLFSRTVGHVRAVDDVSFSIGRRETLGLVGESGCGKTTTGRTILRLLEPTAGEVLFERQPVFDLEGDALRRMRRHMQVIFQDPYGSLNPRRTVARIVGEALSIHGVARGAEQREQVKELLDKVGLNPNHLGRYPHEFSGGQRQRIGIARALALRPQFIVCDEPVSALDVSIQAQIINLLETLQEEFELSYLFIAHDLAVVEHISNRVAVMYLGQIVELAASDALYAHPLHPYTEALLSAIPVPDPTTHTQRILLAGDVPSPADPPRGCRFHPRCPRRFDPCDDAPPPLCEVAPGHWVACHLHTASNHTEGLAP